MVEVDWMGQVSLCQPFGASADATPPDKASPDTALSNIAPRDTALLDTARPTQHRIRGSDVDGLNIY